MLLSSYVSVQSTGLNWRYLSKNKLCLLRNGVSTGILSKFEEPYLHKAFWLMCTTHFLSNHVLLGLVHWPTEVLGLWIWYCFCDIYVYTHTQTFDLEAEIVQQVLLNMLTYKMLHCWTVDCNDRNGTITTTNITHT